jgi:uncharacterized membrane protein
VSYRTSILVVTLLCVRPFPAAAGVMNVCNSGNVTINVAMVQYSISGYRVTGWHNVEPSTCEEVFGASLYDLYLAFAYRDANGALRAHPAGLSDKDQDYNIVRTSEIFCVNGGDAFDYFSRTRPDTACGPGYRPLEFTLFVRLHNVSSMTYTVTPHRDEGGEPLALSTGLLLGRKATLGTDRRWYFDDGSHAFESFGQQVPSAFFDRPAKSVDVTQADVDRLLALGEQLAQLLRPTSVRFNFLSWGDKGRLCFDVGGTIRCAYYAALDYDRTGTSDHSSTFFCRANALCVLRATPWTESTGLGKVRLNDHDMQVVAQASLVVSGLPNQQVARSLVAKVREMSEIVAKVRASGQERAQRR